MIKPEKWIINDNFKQMTIHVCPKCKAEVIWERNIKRAYNFCPTCGMRLQAPDIMPEVKE